MDEEQVLAELEDLQLAIRSARGAGERPTGLAEQPRAFDPPAARNEAVPSAATEPRRQVVGQHADPAPAPARPDIPPMTPARAPAAPAPEDAAAGGPARPRPVLRLVALSAPVLAVALAAVWFLNRAPGPALQPAPAPVASAAIADAPPVEPGAPVQPVDPHPLRIDLTTLRPVWLRVTVDGRVALEREVAAGEQLPFGADRSIVVRAGDAGARDGAGGGRRSGPDRRDGQVLTRTFAAPAR